MKSDFSSENRFSRPAGEMHKYLLDGKIIRTAKIFAGKYFPKKCGAGKFRGEMVGPALVAGPRPADKRQPYTDSNPRLSGVIARSGATKQSSGWIAIILCQGFRHSLEPRRPAVAMRASVDFCGSDLGRDSRVPLDKLWALSPSNGQARSHIQAKPEEEAPGQQTPANKKGAPGDRGADMARRGKQAGLELHLRAELDAPAGHAVVDVEANGSAGEGRTNPAVGAIAG